MRNLKRALSLALASVMLLGMMVVGTSASYTDVTSKNNQEAIEVLQKVGIMTGDDKGNFNPDQKVTRNEMAVIMCNLLDYTVASYKGTSKFTDVPAWAEPYVAACYTNGIIAGYSATTFGGNDSVTTGQAALMLLKALGYFQYASDFGDDWLVATTSQGAKVSLFDDVDTGAREALTRNDVAQMVLNALKADMVDYTGNGGTTVKGDGFEITTGKATYAARTSNSSKYNAITNERANGAAKNTVQLGEELYSGDLKMTEDIHDAYGRPATRWEYKLDKIGDYTDEPLAVYTAKVSKGTLYSLLGKDRLDDINKGNNTLTIVNDGATTVYTKNTADTTAGTVAFDTPARAKFFVNNSSEAYAKGEANEAAKGVQTEVYRNDDGDVTIATIHYYVMKATANYSEAKGELQVSVKTGSANVSRLYDEDFDLSGYKKDDYIIYTYVNNAVEDILPATLVTGDVSAYSSGNSVTLAGTKYSYSKTVKSGDKNTEYRVGDTASVVLDPFGYIVLVDDAAVSVGNYAYVDGVAKKSGLGTDYIAKLYFTDGTKAEVTLNDVYLYQTTAGDTATSLTKVDLAGLKNTTGKTDVNIGTDSNAYLDGWYTFSKNSSGEYTIRAVAAGAQNLTASGAIAGEKVAFATGLKGNANTVMIVDDGDDVTVYTGIKNFPDIGTTTAIKALKEKADATKAYIGVVLVKTTASVDSKDSKTLMYVLNEDTHYVDSVDNERIDVMNVIVDGVVKQIKAKHGDLSEYTLYTKVKEDSSNNYFKGSEEFKDKVDSKYVNTDLDGTQTLSYSKSSLTVGSVSYLVGDDTKITLVMRPVKDSGGTSFTAESLLMKNKVMTDPAADYEYALATDGDNLDSLFNGYKLKGTLSVIKDSTDSDLADTIVLVVNGVKNP